MGQRWTERCMIHKFGIRSIETMRKVDAMSHNSNTVEAISYDVAHCINAGIESCLRQIERSCNGYR
jgi:hypothetical protein